MTQPKTFIAIYKEIPLYDDNGLVITIQAESIKEANSFLRRMPIEWKDGIFLTPCNVFVPLTPDQAVIQFNITHPLTIWALFKMDVCQDPNICGYEGWLELEGITYHACSSDEEKYTIFVTILDGAGSDSN